MDWSQALGRVKRWSILQSAGLVAAPRGHQRAFWQAYNARKRWRFAGLADCAGRIVADARAGRSSGAATGELAQAWFNALPEELAEETWIEGLHRGVLTIRVRNAATRFAVQRLVSDGLVFRLGAFLGDARVRRIRCLLADRRAGDPSFEDER